MNPLQLLIIIVAVWFLVDYWWAWVTAPVQQVYEDRPAPIVTPVQRLVQHPPKVSISDQLEDLQPLAQVRWDGNLHVLSAYVRLHALTQRGGQNSPWTQTGVVSSVLEFDGGTTFLLCIPHAEKGRLTWLQGWCVARESFSSFYKDGDGVPGSGPASVFRKNKQQTPVPYTMPKSITPGEGWSVVDIGSFSVSPKGKSAMFVDGDQLFSVTSRSDRGRFAFYLDARAPNAKGSNLLFIGKLIDPESLQIQ